MNRKDKNITLSVLRKVIFLFLNAKNAKTQSRKVMISNM